MCPHCREPLVAYELEGIEIDRCITCGGTWLDAGEMEEIARLAGAETERLRRVLEGAREGPRSRRRCPRCGARLRTIEVGNGDEAVELDRCPRGDGLWLDRGEMMAVIHRFERGEAGAVARFFKELYRSEIEPDPDGGR
jgi:Zn-finger nucleic acid-binding protein